MPPLQVAGDGARVVAAMTETDPSEPLDQFRQSLIYVAAGSPAELAEDLRRIRELDREAESRVETFRTWAALSWIGCVVTGLIGFVQPWLWLASAALVVSGVVTAVRRNAWMRLDVENRRYEAAVRLLDILGGDIDPAAPVQLQLRLVRTGDASNLKAERHAHGYDVELFENRWLSLGGALLDGSRFELGVVELLQKRSRSRRSASGRLKTKRKQKSRELATLELRVKDRKHPRLAAIVKSAQGAIQLPEAVKALGLTARSGMLRLRVELSPQWVEPGPDEPGDEPRCSTAVAMMFLSLYQVLNLSAKLSRRGLDRPTARGAR